MKKSNIIKAFLFAVFVLQNPLIGSEGKMHKYTNHLIKEKSPYLQQHAHNPVDWYPWGPAAFAKAKKEHKPIFLSIGYATCHWCHVMERESFENEKVAKLMNKAFVNIKLDREEHPDIDSVYMKVCMMLTGSGGWPLTIIMTPEQKPFYAATYIPRESRFGRIGMLELIPKIEEAWKTKRSELELSANRIAAALQRNTVQPVAGPIAVSLMPKRAYQGLVASFDRENGSFGGKPKFPSPSKMNFLLRYWRRTGDKEALRMVEFSLRKIRQGGIYDQIGFGVHRYATDAAWLLPHFEKMLYNQAMLAETYVEAFQATGRKSYKVTASEIYTYVLRDMTAPNGGFYAAEDADSEGEEGKFYVWTRNELGRELSQQEFALVEKIYNIESDGNFNDEATGEKTGENILHLRKPVHSIARELNMGYPELKLRLENIRKKLFKIRKRREHPLKDTKILTDWNGLMIGSLANAARVFDSREYLNAAERAADFIMSGLSGAKGRLFHRWMEGQAIIDGKLDDYAFMIQGLLALYEASFKVKYLEAALRYNDILLKHFYDKQYGGFFMTPDYGEKLLVRPKEIYSGATPSGNAVMIMNLLKLSRLTGRPKYEQLADKIVHNYGKMLVQAPAEFAGVMSSLMFAEGPAYEIVISGDPKSAETKKIIQAVNQLYLSEKVVVLRPDKDSAAIVHIAPYVEAQKMIDGKPTVYICRNNACEKPLVGLKELKGHKLFKDK
jgi:uncharacterized protein